MSILKLNAYLASSVPTPASGKISIFSDLSNGNLPSWKDSAGVVHVFDTTGEAWNVPVNVGTPVVTTGAVNIGPTANSMPGEVINTLTVPYTPTYTVTNPTSLPSLTFGWNPDTDGIANNTAVSAYTSLGTGAVPMSQATGSKQFTKKTAFVNGKGVWQVTGANSQSLSSTATVALASLIGTNNMTLVLGQYLDGSVGGNSPFSIGPNGDPQVISTFFAHTDNYFYFNYFTDQLYNPAPSTFGSGAWHVFAVQKSPALNIESIYMDGIIVSSQLGSTGAAPSESLNINLGFTPGLDQFGGYFSSGWLFNAALTPTQLRGVNNWILQQLGLALVADPPVLTNYANALSVINPSLATVAQIDSYGNVTGLNIASPTAPKSSTIQSQMQVGTDVGGSLDAYVNGTMPYCVLCEGDSLTDTAAYPGTNGTSWTYWVRNALQIIMGNGGPGLQTFDPDTASTEVAYYTLGVDGAGCNWLYTLANANGWNIAPQTYAVDAKGFTWPAATGVGSLTWDPQLAYEKVRLFYLQTPSGGTFNFGFTNMPATTYMPVNTAGTLSLQWIEMSTSSATGTSINISSVNGNVTVFGAYFYNPRGATVNRACHGGDTMANHVLLSWRTNWINAFRPDYYIINLGVNDRTGMSGATFKTDMQTIITQVQASTQPNGVACSIQLMNPSNTSDYGTTNLPAFKTALIQLAASNNVGYQDSVNAIGNYAVANGNGLMIDTLHPTSAGCKIIATDIINYMGVYYDTPAYFRAPAIVDAGRYPIDRSVFPLQIIYPAAVGTAVKIFGFGLPIGNVTTCEVDFELTVLVQDSNGANKSISKIRFNAISTSATAGVVTTMGTLQVDMIRIAGAGHEPSMFTASIDANNCGLITITPPINTVTATMTGMVKVATKLTAGNIIYQV